ncbi:MAG: outer membrane lipoprotein-sorting protein [Gammaproteobacteria bacterium]|nr:outer membrane lipoprotein-sorting protein [Gammaproteobacteria bacterium]
MTLRYACHVGLMSLGLVLAAPCLADEPAPEALLEKAQEIYAGHDSVSKLSFTLHNPDKRDRREDYTMLWMEPESGPIEDKTLLFQTFPPDKLGVAFMNWTYHGEADHEDDSWIYLPELRTIRKISHGMHHHDHHQDPEDEFSLSVLHRAQLLERDPDLDDLFRLPDQTVDGKTFIRIERTPKMAMPDFPYSRTVVWLSDSPIRIEHIDYYDAQGKLVLKQDIDWQQIGKAWVWKEVRAEVPDKDTWTRLEVSDVKVDTGLTESEFSKRRMRQGIR